MKDVSVFEPSSKLYNICQLNLDNKWLLMYFTQVE